MIQCDYVSYLFRFYELRIYKISWVVNKKEEEDLIHSTD